MEFSAVDCGMCDVLGGGEVSHAMSPSGRAMRPSREVAMKTLKMRCEGI